MGLFVRGGLNNQFLLRLDLFLFEGRSPFSGMVQSTFWKLVSVHVLVVLLDDGRREALTIIGKEIDNLQS